MLTYPSGMTMSSRALNLVDAPHYLLLAGGIGVTPLIPMLAELRRRGRTCAFWYGGRNR